jgi:hypothetical protein
VYGDGTFDCTGSATANSIDVTCSSSYTFDPCTVTYTFTLRATKSGNNVYAVSTLNVDYSGTDETCDLLPDSCEQTNTTLTRIGPAPTAYCATPSRRSTWGELKTIYR